MAVKGTYTYHWPRPMVTVDIALLKPDEQSPNPCILLIKRANPPYKGFWALPGGFIEMEEELEQAAKRELKEETSLSGVSLQQLHTFGTCGRDPRGRQITIVYWGIFETSSNHPVAGDDAAEAKWHNSTQLPEKLAFDHLEIIQMALKKYLQQQP